MAQVAQNTMKYWKRGQVIIRPHLEIGDLWSYDQIKQKVDTMKQEIGIQNINIYEKNSYCYELNGSWNVVFGFVLCREDGTLIEYTYMVRRDHLLNKTYFCPFYVEGHGYCSLPKMEFTLEDTPQEFKIVEDYFKEKYNATEISTFPA